MSTVAKLKNIRISAQKVRLVADQVRGLKVDRAINLLTFSEKKAAALMKKLLESAVANAEHNDGLDRDELFIEHVSVDEGPSMKRWRARARGRTAKILKRTSHVTIKVKELRQ